MNLLSKEKFEKLKEGYNPSVIGMDYEEAVKALCDLAESCNEHLHRVDILRQRYLKLDEFICDQIMRSNLMFKNGITEKETVKNIFEFYNNNI
jgi:hypothetical protein